MAPSRNYRDRDIKLLWGLAAARCSLSDCRKECVLPGDSSDETVLIGKMGHIISHSDSGPRADPSFPADQRDRYENLILVCANHHDQVDGQETVFTTPQLYTIKSQHEQWVREKLSSELADVGFAELEVVTQALLCGFNHQSESFTVIPPSEKIQRNQLTNHTSVLISMGLAKAREVGEFVEHVAALDITFPDRLKSGFVARYKERIDDGLSGDALYLDLVDFASGKSGGMPRRAAGIAVLAYLFEKCEVFES